MQAKSINCIDCTNWNSVAYAVQCIAVPKCQMIRDRHLHSPETRLNQAPKLNRMALTQHLGLVVVWAWASYAGSRTICVPTRRGPEGKSWTLGPDRPDGKTIECDNPFINDNCTRALAFFFLGTQVASTRDSNKRPEEKYNKNNTNDN